MNKFLTVVFTITLTLTVFMPLKSYAACNTYQCYGQIQRLFINSGGTLYIATDGDESTLKCTSPGDAYITISANDPNYDRKYTMLLTAMSLKTPVGVRIVEGSSHCSLKNIFMDNE